MKLEPLTCIFHFFQRLPSASMVIFLSILPSRIVFLSDNNIQWFVKENNEVYNHSWPCSSCLDAVQVLNIPNLTLRTCCSKLLRFNTNASNFTIQLNSPPLQRPRVDFHIPDPLFTKIHWGAEPKSQKKWPTGNCIRTIVNYSNLFEIHHYTN